MAATYALGIDSSTQSCSAIVIEPVTGTVVAEASVNFGESLPAYGSPNGFLPDGENGEVHSNPLMWLDALEEVLEALSKRCDLGRVAAISGAGQQHGSVYLNERWQRTLEHLHTGESLASQIAFCLSRKTSPIWMDTSTGEECREIAHAVGGNAVVCAKSGSVATERFTGPQIRRFYKEDAVTYEDTQRIHLVSSFLCSVLVGADAPIDTGDGAGMNLLNLAKGDWDPELMDATAPGLAKKLPPVRGGDAVAGRLALYFSEKYGFGRAVSVQVFTGDNPSSLVGMGASQPGKVVISLGTSDTFFAAMPEPLTDPAGFGHVFGNPSGGTMTLQCFLNGSLAREKVRDRLDMDWDAFSAALQSTPPGNHGKCMLPFFGPEISPRLHLAAPVLDGLTWQDSASVARACVEGQFVNMKLRTDWMQLQTESIFLTGGASKNEAIAQIAADVFDAPVRRLAVSGSVSLGAAIRAAAGAGMASLDELEAAFCQPEPGSIEPSPGAAEVYVNLQKRIAALVAKAGK